MRLSHKIFNFNNIGAPEMRTGQGVMEVAKSQGYSMFMWNRQVYAVPTQPAEWNSMPLFTKEDL